MIPLSPFQIGGLVLLGSVLLLSIRLAVRRRRLASWAWVAVWLGGTVLMLYPELSATMARALGIRRGADLVVYCFMIISSNALFLSYLRDRKLERQITLLVRQMAIRDAREPGQRIPPAAADSETKLRYQEAAETDD